MADCCQQAVFRGIFGLKLANSFRKFRYLLGVVICAHVTSIRGGVDCPLMQQESTISGDEKESRRPSAHVGVGASVIFVTIVVLALAVGGSAWFARSQAERVDHERIDAAAMLIAMLDQETGLRGYLLAQDRSQLAPYARGQHDYSKSFKSLRSSLDGDRRLQNALSDQHRAAGRWQQAAETQLAGGNSGKPLAEGVMKRKQLMDYFRSRQASLVNLLDRRAQQGRVNAQRVPVIIIVVLGILASIVGGWFLRIRNRQQMAVWQRQELHRQAFELNDSVVQTLVVSSYALSMGDTERAAVALEKALMKGKSIISGMLADTDDKTLACHDHSTPANQPEDES